MASTFSNPEDHHEKGSAYWRARIESMLDDQRVELVDSPQPDDHSISYATLFDLAGRLDSHIKVALIKKLLTRLDHSSIQSVVEFSQQELGLKEESLPRHRLKVKKDPGYVKRGRRYPRQYFISIGKNKYHPDIYMGLLFYVDEGYPLSYEITNEGAVAFTSPHNTFVLSSPNKPSKIVRLIQIVPPSPSYPVHKSLDLVNLPASIQVEYLDANFNRIEQKSLQFPRCMYEGGEFDHNVWQAAMVFNQEVLVPENTISLHPAESEKPVEPVKKQPVKKVKRVELTSGDSDQIVCFHLSNTRKSRMLVERLRILVELAEKAMPQARWQLQTQQLSYRLVARSGRMLHFDATQHNLVLETSTATLAEWFKGLGVAISQAENGSQYSSEERAIGRKFVQLETSNSAPFNFLHNVFDFIPSSDWKNC